MNAKMIPSMLYGTAWKEEGTKDLTLSALLAGFTGIDTANQPKHYFEEGVGQGIELFLKESGKKREELFLQSKFTFAAGQDHRKPYDEFAPGKEQVKQSFASSLKHLQTDYLDSYILHGPNSYQGLTDADLEVWSAMESLYHEGKVRFLGISNVNLYQLQLLCQASSVKPAFVQNRCFAMTGWDKEIRTFCQEQELVYQGFSLLTANLQALAVPFMRSLANKYQKTIPQLIFRFCLQNGMVALTGTTNRQHMQDDLNINDFVLNEEDLVLIEALCS